MNNNKIKALIIDDDLPSIRLLEEELKRRDDIELCGTAETLRDGERLIEENNPDVIFLDMKFPEGNGLAWYEEAILPENSHVVFHTCYQRYIHDALSLKVFDFLLKPYEASELDVIIQRLKSMPKGNIAQNGLSTDNANRSASDTSHSSINQQSSRPLSITSVTNSKVIVSPSEIIYFRYLSERKIWECVFYSLKRIILKRQTTAETILGYGKDFVRTHKHFIVNVRYIGIINGNDCVLLPPHDNITEIKISKTYRRDLMDRFYDI